MQILKRMCCQSAIQIWLAGLTCYLLHVAALLLPRGKWPPSNTVVTGTLSTPPGRGSYAHPTCLLKTRLKTKRKRWGCRSCVAACSVSALHCVGLSHGAWVLPCLTRLPGEWFLVTVRGYWEPQCKFTCQGPGENVKNRKTCLELSLPAPLRGEDQAKLRASFPKRLSALLGKQTPASLPHMSPCYPTTCDQQGQDGACRAGYPTSSSFSCIWASISWKIWVNLSVRNSVLQKRWQIELSLLLGRLEREKGVGVGWAGSPCYQTKRCKMIVVLTKKIISWPKKEKENFIWAKFEDYKLGRASRKALRIVPPVRIQGTVM